MGTLLLPSVLLVLFSLLCSFVLFNCMHAGTSPSKMIQCVIEIGLEKIRRDCVHYFVGMAPHTEHVFFISTLLIHLFLLLFIASFSFSLASGLELTTGAQLDFFTSPDDTLTQQVRLYSQPISMVISMFLVFVMLI